MLKIATERPLPAARTVWVPWTYSSGIADEHASVPRVDVVDSLG